MTPEQLEERTFRFADDVRKVVRIVGSAASPTDIDQLIRSSGSVAANYIEANESLGRKDFVMRLRICLKEVRESRLWLRILTSASKASALEEIQRLQNEAEELRRIFGASIRTLERQSQVRNVQ